MNKFFWLTTVVLLCCFAVKAQQAIESANATGDPKQDSAGGSGSVFLNFSAVVRDINKVLLQWNVDNVSDGDYFIIERGMDGVHYETIGALRRTGKAIHYELVDNAPANGTDFYRIKYTGPAGRIVYSRPIQVSLSGEVDFKFYPNPVDKLFIVRTEHQVDIQVIDAGGTVRVTKQCQPGIQVVNISSLERGVYILRVADKESNRVISNQLLKN